MGKSLSLVQETGDDRGAAVWLMSRMTSTDLPFALRVLIEKYREGQKEV